MTSQTADPRAARTHARAMAGSVVDAMPIVPPSAPDVDEDIVWEETVASGGYSGRRLARGSRLRLIDGEGDACVSMLVFNAEQTTERLNVADTMKVQWNGYLGAGSLLLSDMGRVLMTIMEDGATTHDAFCGASSSSTNARRYGDGENHGSHPNARDRLVLGASKHGLSRRDVHPCINWFKGARVESDGSIVPLIGPFPAGRSVLLRAEMDLIVLLANCPHVLDDRPDYRVTPVRATAWRGSAAPADDAMRNATPEGLRAFLNTEDYYAR